nr:MAG TPA: hypothetical protein [Caudoviricetes sp.]
MGIATAKRKAVFLNRFPLNYKKIRCCNRR